VRRHGLGNLGLRHRARLRRPRRARRARDRGQRPDAVRAEPREAQDAHEGQNRSRDPPRLQRERELTMAVTKVVMPKLSDAMETGKIIKWLKKEGDRVQGGDILAEIETDKADVEMEAFGAGVLRKILVPAGEKAPVGTLIGVIAEPTEDIAAVLAAAPAPAAAPGAGGASSARKDTRPEAPPAPAATPAPAPPRPAVVSAPAPATPAVSLAAPASAGRVKASPLAKKIAAQSGVDLRLIRGTGPGGRIIRRDVEAASVTAAAAPAAVTAAPAAALTVPGVEYEDRSLAQIAVDARDLADRARVRKLRAPELSGATFSISNLGMYDVAEFSAIINPPEGAILAVGSVRRMPVVDDAGLGVGRRMALTLSCDHRVMDGAMGARFLQDVKRLLEEPLRLLV